MGIATGPIMALIDEIAAGICCSHAEVHGDIVSGLLELRKGIYRFLRFINYITHTFGYRQGNRSSRRGPAYTKANYFIFYTIAGYLNLLISATYRFYISFVTQLSRQVSADMERHCRSVVACRN
jgi:hypothetical protein